MLRISVCVCVILLLVCGVVPALAQQPADQSNEVLCAGGGTTCKAGFIPKYATNGGSAKVNDSIMSQSGGNIKIAGTESVTGKISAGGGVAALGNVSATGNLSASGNVSATGSVSGATLSGNGSAVTNVNAAALNGFGSGSFAFVGNNNTFSGFNVFSVTQTLAPIFPNPTLLLQDDGVSGDLQPPFMFNAINCCSYGDRMFWAHSSAFPTWGIFYDDSGFDGPADTMHWQTSTGSDVMSVEFGSGNLNVTGAITAGVKDFKIDHPLDPKNKYLYHSSVESSEMMNIYTGNAILDNSGEAVVPLPKWFEAVNTDFRYQLTAIGAPAPNLHVAREIARHQFSIAGGAAGTKVSWQVTGVRHDAYAKAHPLVVEVRKSEKERGHYLHPDAYGAPRLTQEQMLQRRSKP
jgi:hypothetical protein